MDHIKVSIIMATYNCRDTLQRCLDSILAQTYTDWEFVICDDCSTDDTYEILCRYQAENPEKFVILKNEKNSKLSFSLNRCLEVAKGHYIARMDADDASAPERLERQVRFLEENPEYHLVATAMQIYNGKEITGVRVNKVEVPTKYDLLLGPCFAHATIMTYAEVYRSLDGYLVSKRTERGQDYDLWFRFFAKGYKGYNMDQALYIVTEDDAAYKRRKFKYRIHAAQTAWNGYKLVGIEKRYYLLPLKHIVAGLIPQKILERMHRGK